MAVAVTGNDAVRIPAPCDKSTAVYKTTTSTSTSVRGRGTGRRNTRSLTSGDDKLDVFQAHRRPSVDKEYRVLAAVDPTNAKLYTGWACPSVVSGVVCTGADLARMSHNTTRPEYVPPMRQLGMKS